MASGQNDPYAALANQVEDLSQRIDDHDETLRALGGASTDRDLAALREDLGRFAQQLRGQDETLRRLASQPVEDPRRVEALRRELDRVIGQVGGHDDAIRMLAADLETGMGKLLHATPVPSSGVGEDSDDQAAWWWPAMSAEEAESSWRLLADWVENSIIRYSGAASVLRRAPCWYRHGEAVDWLSGCYMAWRGAYSPGAVPHAREEWLDRWLKAATAALNDVLGSCKGGCVLLEDSGTVDLDLTDHIAADLAARRRQETGPVQQ